MGRGVVRKLITRLDIEGRVSWFAPEPFSCQQKGEEVYYNLSFPKKKK